MFVVASLHSYNVHVEQALTTFLLYMHVEFAFQTPAGAASINVRVRLYNRPRNSQEIIRHDSLKQWLKLFNRCIISNRALPVLYTLLEDCSKISSTHVTLMHSS